VAWEIHTGDCIMEMRKLGEGSVDAVVTDPPYGIGFMGHEWDQPGAARAARRKEAAPNFSERRGDHQRTRERSASMHAGEYDLSLTANRRFQAWCEVWAREAFRVLKPGGHLLACGGSRTHHRLASGIEDAGFEIRDRIDTPNGRRVETPDGTLPWYFGSGFPKSADVHKQLCKWAQRVARAWLDCPYGSDRADSRRRDLEARVEQLHEPVEDAEWEGWGTALKPAHELCRRLLIEDSTSWEGGPVGAISSPQGFGDRGGASRFFYCAKTSRAERNAGLEAMAANDHPTVKPINLGRHLVRLVTPPGGVGARHVRRLRIRLAVPPSLRGFDFIGVERETEVRGYCRGSHRLLGPACRPRGRGGSRARQAFQAGGGPQRCKRPRLFTGAHRGRSMTYTLVQGHGVEA
jgi:hypothetical protein